MARGKSRTLGEHVFDALNKARETVESEKSTASSSCGCPAGHVHNEHNKLMAAGRGEPEKKT